MDVTFTNVLEGARQYFQGLPTATPAADSPFYHNQFQPLQHQQQQQHSSNQQQVTSQQQQSTPNQHSSPQSNQPPTQQSNQQYQQNQQYQTSQQYANQQQSNQQLQYRPHGSPYQSQMSSNSAGPPNTAASQAPWADQNRPPTRERTPVQRPSSHSSDGSRPPSHHSLQYPSQDSPRQYQNTFQKESPQPMSQPLQQSFTFSQPQSREQYRSQIASSQAYHTPVPSQVSRSSSKEQLPQPVQNYQYSTAPAYPKSQYDYPQGSYYPQAETQVKNSSYKLLVSEPYPTSIQRLNPYLQVTNNDRFSQAQRYPTENPRTQVSTHQPTSQSIETSYHRNSHTHNLPPIAAFSSYHFSRNTQSKEQTNHINTSYSREVSNPTSSSSSIIKSNQNQRPQTFSGAASSTTHSPEQRTNASQSQPFHQNFSRTSTITTNAYSSVIMTNISSSSAKSNQPASNLQSYYHGPNKSFIKNAEEYQANRQNENQTSRLPPTQPPAAESRSVPVIKENPLDLSVKTVKTTADSTLQESETNTRTQQSQRSSHIYPTFDMQRNLTQRTQPPILSAPKVDFQPKFNIPSANHQVHLPERQHNHLQKPTSTPSDIYNSTYPHPDVSASGTPQIRPNANPYQYNNLPRNIPQSNYPTADQKNNIPRPYHYPEVNKKRHAEVTSSAIPEKMPKVETWRQSIDLQIEQKLSSYKQDKLQQSPTPTVNKPTTNINGNYPSLNARDIYGFNHLENYKTPVSQSSKSIPYSQIQTNHSQTYVPSPNAHRYPNYNYMPRQVNNHYINPYAATVNPMLPPNLSKQQIPGSVDRKTLNLLRNSIETKEQKKIGQIKIQENLPLHPRPEIQHSNTDVTAPLQPKLGVVGRNNVSPFTPTSFPETNMASMYKFNHQKPIGSMNNYQTQLKDFIKLEENSTVIVNNTNSGSDYDGLAAFLAARIRTKGELKQVGPNNNAARNARVQMYVNEQIKSPPPPLSETPLVQNSSLTSTSSSTDSSVSPPKLVKENLQNTPRKRLFSKTEEEQSSNNNLPRRDKSGIRSSSETSVFDFDDDDDNQMPVLERQSLEAMRRDRRSSIKLTGIPSLEEVKEESKDEENLPPPSRTPSPFDEAFANICDNFVDYLKNGPKKRGRKKKVVPETPIKTEPSSEQTVDDKMETTTDFTRVEVKKEIIEEEVNASENNNSIDGGTRTIIPHKIGILSDSDLSDSETKKEKLAERNKNKVRRKILSSSESSDEEPEKEKPTEVKVEEVVENKETSDNKEIEEPETKEVELIKPADIKQEKVEPPQENKPTENKEIIKEEPIKKLDTLTVIRPAKKPLFGTGSEFCQPGWEEEVFRYKKSLRMPSSLIQVTRPPNSRLSTSLPDLDPPCPPSPTPSMASSMVTDSEASKDCNNKTIKKFKSEPIDSDSESTTTFNIFSKKTNYDSEESSSSLPNTKTEKTSILDKLLEKCGGRKKRKYNRKDDHSPKVIPKSENNLLPTPGFEASEKESPVKDKKIKGPIVSEKSALLNFRKDTINTFKDAFIKSNNAVIHNKFATVVLTSRTRKETKALQQRATIKEVFGDERPASAPPCEVTAMNNISIKEEAIENAEFSAKLKELALQKEAEAIKEITTVKECKKEQNDKDIITDDLEEKQIKEEVLDDSDSERKLIEFVIKRDPDAKYETTSLDSEEGLINKRRNKFGKLRRKFSSGFDYIRKKKKIKKESNTEMTETPFAEKKKRLSNKILESVDDIQKEIKTWVLNKGIGESHLHRAARLGYTDITAYCLEKMDCHPSPKDNAGYTPLHEACSRGHLQIAKLLLMYGANVHESAQGGIRPLHMAVENGYVEIVRLLLSYGADPSLGTYAGMTPINLANDEDTKDLLLHHESDRGAERGPPWQFRGPASCFDETEELGYNMFDSPPKMDSDFELDDVEFEISESMLPNLYTIRNEPSCDKWVLLQDLSNYLKVKSRDTLLRQLSPDNQQANSKNLIRELKMADFLEQARCCQFLNQGEKLNTRANKIALVKFTDRVKQLLGIETVTVSR